MTNEYADVNNNGINCDFILEPFGRNTAAAVLAAVFHVKKYYSENAALLLLPADYLISDEISFAKAVTQAIDSAKSGYLVTFGIKPDYPETGYGYIEANQQSQLGLGYLVQHFVEKLSLAVAEEYVSSGNYLWNAGMFCGTAKTFIAEI